MRAARMYGYKQPLVIEDVPLPDVAADEVLLKVSAAGMCRTDAQLATPKVASLPHAARADH